MRAAPAMFCTLSAPSGLLEAPIPLGQLSPRQSSVAAASHIWLLSATGNYILFFFFFN